MPTAFELLRKVPFNGLLHQFISGVYVCGLGRGLSSSFSAKASTRSYLLRRRAFVATYLMERMRARDPDIDTDLV